MRQCDALASKLDSEGQKMVTFLSTLTPIQWETRVYTEGVVWTVRNAVAHLMTAERAFVKLFEQIRQSGQGVSADFAIDRYNASQQRKTAGLTAPELLEAYIVIRREMVSWVARLDDADLEKQGRHPYLGVTTLCEMIKLIYVHNQLHYRDIRSALTD